MILEKVERYMENAAETIQGNFEGIADNLTTTKYYPMYKAGFRDYSAGQKLTCSKLGKAVSIAGASANNAAVLEAGASVVICVLPEEVRPTRTESNICQASGNNTFLLEINAAGEVIFSRHRTGAIDSQAKVNTWMNINLNFIQD